MILSVYQTCIGCEVRYLSLVLIILLLGKRGPYNIEIKFLLKRIPDTLLIM